jgi:hypothetical protein
MWGFFVSHTLQNANISKMLMIPWLATEANEWVVMNKAVDLESPQFRGNVTPPYPDDIDSTIKIALRDLTERLRQTKLYESNFYHYFVSRCFTKKSGKVADMVFDGRKRKRKRIKRRGLLAFKSSFLSV